MICFTLKSRNGATQDEMYKDTEVARRAADIFLSMPQALPWHTGYTYQGHTLNRKGKGWLLVVKASRGDSRCVAFFEGRSPTRCAQQLAFQAVYGAVDWKRDKYQ